MGKAGFFRWTKGNRGSTTLMLIGVWTLILVAFSFAYDLSVAFVYRQRLRTALEAGGTAAAQQFRYQMLVSVTRQEWYEREEFYMCPGSDGESGGDPEESEEPEPQMCSQFVWDMRPVPDWQGWRLEEEVWTPHTADGEEFFRVPALGEQQAAGPRCGPWSPSHGRYRCGRATVVDCRFVVKGRPVQAAEEAFGLNTASWAGVELLPIEISWGPEPERAAQPGVGPDGDPDRMFPVTVTGQARVPTLFVKILGDEFRFLIVEATAAVRLGRMNANPCGNPKGWSEGGGFYSPR